MCENTFTCTSRVNFVGYEFDGVHWFVTMLVVAFLLQISSNWAWLRISQSYREILHEMPMSKERAALLPYNLLWTGIWTTIFVLRIAFIAGSNIYVFFIILLGNITGTAWALSVQEQDITAESFKNVCNKKQWPDKTIEELHYRLKEIENRNSELIKKKLML